MRWNLGLGFAMICCLGCLPDPALAADSRLAACTLQNDRANPSHTLQTMNLDLFFCCCGRHDMMFGMRFPALLELIRKECDDDDDDDDYGDGDGVDGGYGCVDRHGGGDDDSDGDDHCDDGCGDGDGDDAGIGSVMLSLIMITMMVKRARVMCS